MCTWTPALLRITSKQKTQVIYNHWVIPNGLVAAWVARIRHIPFVVTLHGSDIYLARKVRSFGWVASWIFRRSSAVTTNSPELRQAALDLGAPQNTALVSFGGDPLAFNPSSRSDAFRRSLAPDPSAVIVAALGRFVYKKGFDILLSAFPDVLRECPQAVMVLGGDGPLMNDLKRQADLAGISQWVLFPGRIPWDQVPEFLASADIFVISSIRDQYGNVDGCPTVLFEAMSVGVPVIASDIGGVSLVVKNGQNGVLVPPGDAHVLSQTITTLIRDQQMRQAIAVDARRTIETHHNWYNVAVQLSSILDGVVHGSNTPT
jgi:glycosyltransferase involved in cell wall biosynthesis